MTNTAMFQPLPVFLPLNSNHIPSPWAHNIQPGVISNEVEEMLDDFIFWDYHFPIFDRPLEDFREICDFILHRAILSGKHFEQELQKLAPGNISKAQRLNDALLTSEVEKQLSFLSLLEGRGHKYGFSLGEIKALIYISTRPYKSHQRWQHPIGHSCPLLSGRRGGFRDEEGLLSLSIALYDTLDLIENAEATLRNCHHWSAAVVHYYDSRNYICEEDVQLFSLVGLFRPLLHKLCKLYRRLCPQFAHDTFNPTVEPQWKDEGLLVLEN